MKGKRYVVSGEINRAAGLRRGGGWGGEGRGTLKTISTFILPGRYPRLKGTLVHHQCGNWELRWLVECCFTSTETVGLLGTGAQDGHLDFHTAPELWGTSRGRRPVLTVMVDWV